MSARQVFYEGNVQGVGFRYTVKQIARGFEVTGWVRNLPDGRVELQCVGASDELDALLDAIAESELKSHIRSAKASSIPPFTARGFEIVH